MDFGGGGILDWIAVLALPKIVTLHLFNASSEPRPTLCRVDSLNNLVPAFPTERDSWCELKSTLKSLTLDKFDMRSHDEHDEILMQRIADSCPLLESLKIHTEGVYSMYRGREAYRNTLALFSKNIVEGVLREIEVWDCQIKSMHSLSQPTYAPMKGLSEVRAHGKLEVVELDVQILMEKSSERSIHLDLELPNTLKLLKLRTGIVTPDISHATILRALNEMACSNFRLRFPCLTTIFIINDVFSEYQLEESEMHELKEAFGTHGVRFEFL